MIAFVKGKVAWVGQGVVVIDVNGVGYKINVYPACAARLSEAENEVLVHTHMIVKEDDIQLYGFIKPDEIEVFLLLLGVNGVGPRAAMTIMSFLTPSDLSRALAMEDITALTKAPGIGKKIAQRIILELKDKFSKLNLEYVDTNNQITKLSSNNGRDDALAALLSLGYNTGEAREAIRKAEREAAGNVSELIKIALRYLDKSKQ